MGVWCEMWLELLRNAITLASLTSCFSRNNIELSLYKINPQLYEPLLGNYRLFLRNMMNFCCQTDSIIVSPRPAGVQLKGQSSLKSALRAATIVKALFSLVKRAVNGSRGPRSSFPTKLS